MIEILRLIVWAFNLALIGRVVMSFVSPRGNDPISNLFYQITEPVLGPIRRFLPNTGMIDLSPMVALIVVNLIVDRLLRVL